MSQKGFTPVAILIGILIVGAIGAVFYTKQYRSNSNMSVAPPETTIKPSPTPKTPASSPSVYVTQPPTSKPSPKTFPATTNTPIPTSTTAPNNTSTSNPYDLNSATGSVKVMVKAQSGSLDFTPQAELTTVSGFKVLDGRSTDKLTAFGKDRTDEFRGEINFSTVPPGPYKVRISYNGSWSDQKDITVSSAKQAYVEFSVAGVAPTPTPTPRPKPICSVSVIPSSTGTAPFEASVCVGNNSNPYQVVQKEFVNYDGNGSWDYEGAQYGCHSYTFQNPGTYTPKAKTIGASGDESDVCQTSVTIN